MSPEPGRKRAWRSGAIGALLALAVLPVLTVATVDSPATALELHRCDLDGVPARCGTLPVYEDRAAGSGRMIELRIAVVPARSGRSAPDPVFFLSGGPGGAATADAGGALSVLGLANLERDIVFVDQRGTGGSNELTCPRSGLLPGEEDAGELAACLATLPGDPRAYTTAWAMDDLDEVRAALGYPTINLYGGSYGATAAQVYLQRYPERVRTATLIGGTSDRKSVV